MRVLVVGLCIIQTLLPYCKEYYIIDLHTTGLYKGYCENHIDNCNT